MRIPSAPVLSVLSEKIHPWLSDGRRPPVTICPAGSCEDRIGRLRARRPWALGAAPTAMWGGAVARRTLPAPGQVGAGRLEHSFILAPHGIPACLCSRGLERLV